MSARAMWKSSSAIPLILLLLNSAALAQKGEWMQVSLSDSLGPEITAVQRSAYHLFPDIARFESARFYTKGGSSYRLEYSYRTQLEVSEIAKRRISATTWELTRAHVALVEAYHRRIALPIPGIDPEAETLYRLVLKYASRGRYDLSRLLLDDLLAEYPSSAPAHDAATIKDDIGRLAQARRALFLPGGLLDQSGRTDLMIFSGYYGLWLGIAIPVALKAEASEWYALGLITGAPLSLIMTYRWTKDAEMGKGRASIIALGGNLGTWQGLGWSGMADVNGHEVVGIGILGGLAGIAGATLLTHNVYFSEGHGALTSSAETWGAWFGVAGGVVAGADGNDLLRTTLLGSDALVLTTGILARNVHMSQSRVRMISLMGVVGTVAGFGVDVLARVDDGKAVMAIAGLGSIGGLIAGATMTANYDKGKDLALETPDQRPARWAVTPRFAFAPDHSHVGKLIPTASLQLTF